MRPQPNRGPTALAVVIALSFSISPDVSAQAAAPAPCRIEQRFSPARRACHPRVLTSLPLRFTPAGQNGVQLLPTTIQTGFRSGYAMDRENGPVWAGRGAHIVASTGVSFRLGPLVGAIHPSTGWAENRAFAVADTALAGYLPFALPWEGGSIDLPQRFGDGPDTFVHPGQTFVEIRGWQGARLGISTENLWWGPSRRYPLVLGPTAAGFPHLYADLPAVPIGGAWASIGALWGRLQESSHFDGSDVNDRNLVGALRLEIGHRQARDARFAFYSVVRQRWEGLTLAGALDLLQIDHVQSQRDLKQIDRFVAVSGSLPLKGEESVLYATWGRGDGFLDAEDLITEIDHSQFWMVGLRHRWADRWRVTFEHASTAASNDQFGLRGDSRTIYRHASNRQGYTHEGQLLGASIGPGSVATLLMLEGESGPHSGGLYLERILWDRDTHRRTFRRSIGPQTEDREWLLGARVPDLTPSSPLQIAVDLGAAIRANRQYVRFTGENRDLLPHSEWNLWLDLTVSWAPAP